MPVLNKLSASSLKGISVGKHGDGGGLWFEKRKDGEKERREVLSRLHILRDIANDAFESRKAELKDDGKAGRWLSPLELYVLPRLGKMPVSEIDQRDIRDTFAPIWHDKADAARKAMNRLGICLKHAAALGLEVDLQATDKAKALLGKQRHVAKNLPSLPWQEVPSFYQCPLPHAALSCSILRR